jgi:hypothetical protein
MRSMPLKGPDCRWTDDLDNMPWWPCLVHGQHGVGIQVRWTGGGARPTVRGRKCWLRLSQRHTATHLNVCQLLDCAVPCCFRCGMRCRSAMQIDAAGGVHCSIYALNSFESLQIMLALHLIHPSARPALLQPRRRLCGVQHATSHVCNSGNCTTRAAADSQHLFVSCRIFVVNQSKESQLPELRSFVCQ